MSTRYDQLDPRLGQPRRQNGTTIDFAEGLPIALVAVSAVVLAVTSLLAPAPPILADDAPLARAASASTTNAPVPGTSRPDLAEAGGREPWIVTEEGLQPVPPLSSSRPLFCLAASDSPGCRVARRIAELEPCSKPRGCRAYELLRELGAEPRLELARPRGRELPSAERAVAPRETTSGRTPRRP